MVLLVWTYLPTARKLKEGFVFKDDEEEEESYVTRYLQPSDVLVCVSLRDRETARAR